MYHVLTSAHYFRIATLQVLIIVDSSALAKADIAVMAVTHSEQNSECNSSLIRVYFTGELYSWHLIVFVLL